MRSAPLWYALSLTSNSFPTRCAQITVGLLAQLVVILDMNAVHTDMNKQTKRPDSKNTDPHSKAEFRRYARGLRMIGLLETGCESRRTRTPSDTRNEPSLWDSLKMLFTGKL